MPHGGSSVGSAVRAEPARAARPGSGDGGGRPARRRARPRIPKPASQQPKKIEIQELDRPPTDGGRPTRSMSTDDAARLGDTISERPQAMPAGWTTTLGVIAAPGLTAELAAQVGDDLAGELDRRFPEQAWLVAVSRTPSSRRLPRPRARRRGAPAAPGRALGVRRLPHRPAAVRHRPADRRTRKREPQRRPALGPGARRGRTAPPDPRVRPAARRDAARCRRRRRADRQRTGGGAAPARGPRRGRRRAGGPGRTRRAGPGGRARLLLGMLRANQPWRLAARLYRALVAALAVVAVALVTSDVWRIAASLGALRLAVLTSCSIAATTISLIVVHGLWETTRHEHARDQVRLFNLVTTLTVLVGVAALYAALFLVTLAGALLLITPDLLGARPRTARGLAPGGRARVARDLARHPGRRTRRRPGGECGRARGGLRVPGGRRLGLTPSALRVQTEHPLDGPRPTDHVPWAKSTPISRSRARVRRVSTPSATVCWPKPRARFTTACTTWRLPSSRGSSRTNSLSILR